MNSQKNLQELADFIQKWKTDGKNAVELSESIPILEILQLTELAEFRTKNEEESH